jgi:type I restriction enzyme S subunit
VSFVDDIAALVAQSEDPLVASPDDWQRVPLGQVAQIVNGFPFSSSRFNRTSGVPVARIRDVVRGHSETYYDGSVNGAPVIDDGDLLVGMDGDFNAAAWRGGRAVLNQRVSKITPDEKALDRKFLGFVLPAYLRLVNDKTPSTTVKHLSSRTLAQIPLPLPPLALQERIAAKLDELLTEIEDGEEELRRARQELETYRKSLLKAAVTGELTADWRSANPLKETGEQLLNRILNERREGWAADPKNRAKRYREPGAPSLGLPRPPQGWAWASIDQLIYELKNGISTKPGRVPPGSPILRISSVREMQVNAADLRYLAPDVDASEATVRTGDLLFTRYNGSPELVGVCGRYRGTEPLAYPDKLMRARVVAAECDLPDFLEIAANAGVTRQFLAAHTRTTAGQHGVSGDTVKRAPVPVPPLDELRRIVHLVQVNLAQREQLLHDASAIAGSSTLLRQSVLAAAFRGELVQ